MESKQIAWYGALIATLFIIGIMVERLPWGDLDFFTVMDYMITRGALLLGVYLLWRLVKAYERRESGTKENEPHH